LHDVEKKCRADVPVLDKRGQPTGEYRFDSAGANRALELIGKHLGMFKERVEHTGPDGGPIRVEHDLSGLTIDDLARLESILEKTKARPT
jgi:phage terminase small subunit